VIVHVVAKPEAIQNRAFEKLLASKDISIEPEPLSEKKERAGGNSNPATNKADDQLADKSNLTSSGSDEDLVLVDAPRDKIVSCLAELQHDAANYVGVSVDEPQPNLDRAQVSKSLEQKPTTDFGRYSRGAVAPQQQDSLRSRLYYYGALKDEQEKQKSATDQDLRQEVDRKPQRSDVAQSKDPVALSENRGRARRIALADLGAGQRMSRRWVAAGQADLLRTNR